MSSALVMTHRVVADTRPAFEPLLAAATAAGFELLFDAEETAKHGLAAREGMVVDADPSDGVDLCIVLGGDGTILHALRRFADTEVPVFAMNFGEVGFLATVEPEEMEDGFRRAFAHDFEVLRLPAVVLSGLDGDKAAINDVSIHRKVGERVAQLAYAIEDAELGSVRCDGLVIATPAGSTGYNLANAGPVMAWGVEGFAVSFIAPHSLTARALVVAPNDTLTVHNRGRDVVDVIVDGRPVGELPPGDAVSATFRHDVANLAQVAGTSFYRRLRQKFGRLSS
ncbi:MAG TPA: NAD(+)/NADH kinase [Solirubrobacteraceae bacterium]|nr:NAD(+)/NADH kinase [Solirubrobacteraceae bacterium]